MDEQAAGAAGTTSRKGPLAATAGSGKHHYQSLSHRIEPAAPGEPKASPLAYGKVAMCLLGTGCRIQPDESASAGFTPRPATIFPTRRHSAAIRCCGPEWRHQHADACPRIVVVAGLRQRSDPATDATYQPVPPATAAGGLRMTPSVNRSPSPTSSALKEGQIRYCESLGFSPAGAVRADAPYRR